MIGIDIIELYRIEKAIEEYGEKFLRKIFTPFEIQYCESYQTRIEKYAARFAVKEAVAKIIKEGHANFFLDIEIRNHQSGAPYVILSDRLRKIFPHPIEISMSHCKEYAVGVAIVVSH